MQPQAAVNGAPKKRFDAASNGLPMFAPATPPAPGRLMGSVTSSVELPWDDVHAVLRAFIGRRVRNPADADDLVQQVGIHRSPSRKGGLMGACA